MKNIRRINEEADQFGMQSGVSNPQTASPDSEKPWTSWYNNLMDGAKARKAKAQSVVDQSQVTKDDLDGLAENRNQRTVASGLQGAANQFLSVGGEAPKSNLNETFDALNKGQEGDIGARQKLVTQAGSDIKQANEDIGSSMKMPFEMDKMQSEKEDADPNSTQSQSARAFIEQNIGVKLPPNLSAKQLSSSSTIQPLMAKWNAERAEANLKASQDFQVGRDRENQRFQANQGALSRADSAANRDADRVSKETLTREGFEAKTKEADIKRAEAETQLEVPGYGVASDGNAAKLARKAAATKESLVRKFGELKALTQPNGKTNIDIVGDNSNLVASKLTEMRMLLKEVNDLGALSGPDWKIIQAELPDLTSISAGAKNFFGASDPFKPIDGTVNSALQDLDTNIKTQMRKKGSLVTPSANTSQGSTGGVKTFDKNNVPDPW